MSRSPTRPSRAHARALDLAADDHARRCDAAHRGVERAQDARPSHGHGRRLRGTRHRARTRAARRLARQPDHGRRHALHGALQRLDTAVHPALERARLRHRQHGRGRGRADRHQRGVRRPRGDHALHGRRMAGGSLSRRRRRGAGVLPLGLRPAVREPDPGRQHHDGQSDRRRVIGDIPRRRADHAQFGGRVDRGLCRYLAGDQRERQGALKS